MSAFKLQTLKQKLWAIVAASFVARVIMFFALPNTPSSLAPDEAPMHFWLNGLENPNPLQSFQHMGKAYIYLGDQ